MRNHRPLLKAPAVPGASVSITFKGLGTYDYPSAFTWPPPQDEDVSGTNERSGIQAPRQAPPSFVASSLSGQSNDYVTHYRSPFSVLRSRQSRVNRCAAGILGASFDTSSRYLLSRHSGAPCMNPYCCCSALMYPVTTEAHTETAERVRDDFLWALKVGGVEDLLRSTLGADLYARLMAELGASPVAAAVLACSDPIKMARLLSLEVEAAPTAAAVNDAGKRDEGTSPTSSAEAGNSAFVARLLLSADEDNRIRWLQEESATMEPSDYYSRAPSLRALFIMWSLLQHQQFMRSSAVLGSGVGGAEGRNTDGGGGGDGPRVRSPASARSPSSLVPCPQMNEIRHVLLRMEERRMEVMMSDIAALAAIGIDGTSSSTAVPGDEFWDSLAKLLKPQEVAAALHACCLPPSPSSGHTGAVTLAEEALGLQHVLLLCLMLRYVLRVRAEVACREAALSQPHSPSALAMRSKLLLPITAFEAASDVIQLRKMLTEAPAEGKGVDSTPRASLAVRDAIVALSDVVLKHAFEMAEASHISSSSPDLPELTTWLLREMVSSPVCAFHFKRLVDRSITEALVALEKSGLVNRSTIDLKVVVRQLLPLLESCGSEDLYTSVLRDVLSALEEKARRDGYAFSAEDLQYLAELGTKLFTSGSSDSTAGGYGLFDETARGQMEELHVMDGSPWALCVSSYRSIKEMLQGIARDQRRLKEQVQDQLRQLSNANSLSAVMTGKSGETEAEKRKATDDAASSLPGAQGGAPETAAASSTTAQKEDRANLADTSNDDDSAAEGAPAVPPRIPVSPMLRQRFLVLIEELVKSQVDESSANSERPIVLSSELFAFVTQHVPVPNIQDEYRRKIFLLVNVAENPETTRRRIAQRRAERQQRQRMEAAAAAKSSGVAKLRRQSRLKGRSDAAEAEGDGSSSSKSDSGEAVEAEKAEGEELDTDPHGGANDIPAELRFLVSSLPLTLSPWASVMILREVLAESAGRNPRYTYVLSAAIDLQLPISTTRSRIATTLNMWRFLNTQSHKLSLKESLVMKQRCAWNLPLSYILSSYWSLLTWLVLTSIVMLNVVGIDWESQIVANSLFRMFAPWEEICSTPPDEEGDAEEAWTTQAAADLAADYFEQAEIADRRREEHRRSSTNVFLSSASYLILGYDDQRRPMTIIPIGSDCAEAAEARVAEEYAAATAVLRELSLHVPFPFFVDIERALPIELVEMRIAERIRRVSLSNTWFLPRMVISTFPLGRQYTEHKLILHTCTQANLTRRRVTFLLYMHDGVAVTPQFIQKLNESYLSKHANLVLVVHESSLLKGGTSPASLARISQSSTADGTGNGGGVESLESIANAAAGMIGSVLPDDVREATVGGTYAGGAAPARQVRVLPFCRQYYSKDGTAVSDAVRDKGKQADVPEATDAYAVVAEGRDENRGWWRRVVSYVTGADKATAAAAAAEAEAASALPIFASAFSAQRASLYRTRQRQRQQQSEAEEAGALARQQQQQQQQPQMQWSLGQGVSLTGRWVQWWRQILFGPMTRDAGENRPEQSTHGEGARRATTEEGADATTATMATAGRRSGPDYDEYYHHSSDVRDDAAEEHAGKDVVSVSFAAMRRLMADVSAPVPIPRKKHTSSSNSSSSSSGSSTSSSNGASAAATAAALANAEGETASSAPSSSSVPSTSSSARGLGRFWSLFYGSNTTLEADAAAAKEETPTVVVATPPPAPSPGPAATQRQSYSFHNNNSSSSSSNRTTNTAAATAVNSDPSLPSSPSAAASVRKVPSSLPISRLSTAETAAGVASSSPMSPVASSLSFTPLPTSELIRQNGFKWESEWQKADEMLAQLRRTTGTNTYST